LPALAQALATGDAEVRRRAVGILTTHCSSPRAELRQAARSLLEELARSADERAGQLARQALACVYEAAAHAAAGELSRLGATVMPAQTGEPLTFNVQIGENWSGGDQRLSLLAELGTVPWLSLENAPVGDGALAHVAALGHRRHGLGKLYLGSSRVTGHNLAALAPLQSLQYLSLKQLPIDDAKLAALPDFPQLQYLGLDGTMVSDAGLAALARYPKLQVLWLDHTPVTDAGLPRLRPLAQLRTLYLPGTKVTGSGLAELKHFPSLVSLSLKGTRLARESLNQLAQIQQLESLGLDDTNVVDDQIADLLPLPRLRIIWLSGTGITDAAIDHLKRLRSLQIVHLSNTNVTDAGLAELQRSLPGCDVTMIGREQPSIAPASR
jgi:hypothetical protein